MGGLIQIDMMIEICTMAIIYGRDVNATIPELIDKRRNAIGTHRGPAGVTDFLVKRLY